MREHRVTLPELALLAGTRGLIGFGVGLLISDRLGPEYRRAAGLTSLVVGALSTIPLWVMLFGERRSEPRTLDERRRDVDAGRRSEPAAMMAD
jgi:hypothetical protein